jgi:hypothetical protein
MKDDPIQTIKRLEDSLIDTSGESTAELRKELESGGVDVNSFLARLKGVVRKGYQHQMRLQNQKASDLANTAIGSIFGDLSALASGQLRDLIAQVLGGGFGSVAQSAARCRNYQGNELSDEEIRSWLKDIEKLAQK